jgi:hypothetical protein
MQRTTTHHKISDSSPNTCIPLHADIHAGRLLVLFWAKVFSKTLELGAWCPSCQTHHQKGIHSMTSFEPVLLGGYLIWLWITGSGCLNISDWENGPFWSFSKPSKTHWFSWKNRHLSGWVFGKKNQFWELFVCVCVCVYIYGFRV